MTGLKIRYWLEKHKTYIIIVLLLMGLSSVIWLSLHVSIHIIKVDSTVFGVAGTLLGAVIGGSLSLLGSVWINKRQQQARRNLKRMNVIYSPLYDELVEIRDRVLVQNPYPNHVEFNKEVSPQYNCLQYDAWRRIKLDTRYLEVPKYLKEQIGRLETSIAEYMKVRGDASTEVQLILNDVLAANMERQCGIKTLARFFRVMFWQIPKLILHVRR